MHDIVIQVLLTISNLEKIYKKLYLLDKFAVCLFQSTSLPSWYMDEGNSHRFHDEPSTINYFKRNRKASLGITMQLTRKEEIKFTQI
jgi:hypothetical protein